MTDLDVGDEVVRAGNSQKVLTVMLSGVACRYRIIDNGRRQIFAFQYAGDFAIIVGTSCCNATMQWLP